MIKICEYCREEFDTPNKNARFCSRECRGKADRKRVKCVCENCGKIFYKIPSEVKEKNFCSKKCWYEYAHEEVTCKECGKTFDAKKGQHRVFCSNKCKNKYISQHQKENKEDIICKQCGKHFQSQVSNHREFCSKECAYQYRSENIESFEFYQKRAEETKKSFFERLGEMKTNIVVDGEFKNMTTKIKCHCSEHQQEFEISPVKILSGQNGCTKCRGSKGENKIAEVLEKLGIQYERQKRYKDCKDIKPLPFDFYLVTYDILIEFDGEQHFKPSFTKNKDKANKNFEKLKLHDDIKNKYCKKKGIRLVRIPYFNFDDIEKIISQIKEECE